MSCGDGIHPAIFAFDRVRRGLSRLLRADPRRVGRPEDGRSPARAVTRKAFTAAVDDCRKDMAR